MKNYIAIIIIATLLFGACKDESVGPVLKIGNAPAITAPAANASFVLTEATADEVITEFTWTGADFGFKAAVTYRLEMDLKGKNFADPISLGVSNGLQIGNVTKGTINNILNAKELPPNVPVDLEVRLAATVSPDVETLYSPPVGIKVTPYEIVVVYPQLQVPGSYQGWDPANNETIIYSLKSDKKYEGYVYFKDNNSKFKYTDGPSWDVNWGDDGNNGTLERNGADIPAGPAGVYKLNVDINGLTHTYLRTDWGLIGSATPGGWDSDQNMTFDQATNRFTITLDLIAGEIKFRANDDWAINFGDTGANSSLEYNGDNIAISTAGNYTIELILNVPKYTYRIKKN